MKRPGVNTIIVYDVEALHNSETHSLTASFSSRNVPNSDALVSLQLATSVLRSAFLLEIYPESP